MDGTNRACFSLGSNIRPEQNLPAAVACLRAYGRIAAISSVWETRAVGSDGPNFLNLSLLILTDCRAELLKETIVRPVEARLGRVRSDDKNAPRTIDVDPLIYNDRPLTLRIWEMPFLAVPTAEIAPQLAHPETGETLSDAAARVKLTAWIRQRSDLFTGRD